MTVDSDTLQRLAVLETNDRQREKTCHGHLEKLDIILQGMTELRTRETFTAEQIAAVAPKLDALGEGVGAVRAGLDRIGDRLDIVEQRLDTAEERLDEARMRGAALSAKGAIIVSMLGVLGAALVSVAIARAFPASPPSAGPQLSTSVSRSGSGLTTATTAQPSAPP